MTTTGVPTLTKRQIATLQRLQEQASKPGIKTKQDAAAAQRLASLLADHIAAGVPKKHLAKHLGISHAAVNRRLEQGGFREPPPSQIGRPSGMRRRPKTADADIPTPAGVGA